MWSSGIRFPTTPIIMGICLLFGGCAWKSVPATVSKLQLWPAAAITAVSLGRDGRVWFATTRNGPGPGVGYIDQGGDIEITQLDPVSYGHYIGGLAVDENHGVWATMPCSKYVPRCVGAGYARFGGDYGPLTKIHSLGNAGATPNGIAMADDRSVWIAEWNANAIVHVSPYDKETAVKLADREFKPVGAEADGRGGAYFDGPEAGKIVAVDRRGRIRTYVLPTRTSHTSSAVPGPDGTIWVAEYDADKIVEIDPKGGMTEYAVPTPNGGPATVAVDRSGVVWFIELNGQKIGRIDPDGTVKDAYLPLDVGTPAFLVAAPNDTLVVIGYTKEIFRTSLTWALARIPEATAAM
jgi:sugar lactone lactonase YvrE